MKIAISTDGQYVSAHFGRCPHYTIVEIEQGQVLNKELVPNPGHQQGFLPQFLHQSGVNCIITGGMGWRATGLFAEQGIETILGISGSIDDVIERFIRGELKTSENPCEPGAGRGYGIEKIKEE